ncbi:hypothetical protein Trydic_g19438 [Trypoxylus dichotomus]
MRRARYEWAKRHQNYTIEDCRKIVFSDESKLEAMIERAQFVRRRPFERFLLQTVQHPLPAKVCSCI